MPCPACARFTRSAQWGPQASASRPARLHLHLALLTSSLSSGLAALQALLASRALELSVEGCLLEPVTAAAEPVLADVLRALLAPSLPPTVPAVLASRVVQLSGLAAADSAAARSSAAIAVSSLVAALKAPSMEDPPPSTGQRRGGAVPAAAAAAGASLEDVE